MKLLLVFVLIAILSFATITTGVQVPVSALPACDGSMTFECDSSNGGDDIRDDIVGGKDNPDYDRIIQNDKENRDDNDNNNNDNNDKSELKGNDGCNLHGEYICDKNGDCDDNHFDCITDLGGDNYCTTGMCPGDDKKSSGSNHNDNHKKNSDNGNNCDSSYPDFCIESPPPDLNCGDISKNNFKVSGSDPHGFDGDNDGKGCESPGSGSGGNSNGNGNDKRSSSNNDNHKSTSDNNNGGDNNHQSSSCCYDSKKGFNVEIALKYPESTKYLVRVIVNGVSTLNKPTLDKPGQMVIPNCITCFFNAGMWSFTDSKVQNGDSIKACAVNIKNYVVSCGYGTAHKDRTDTIYIPLS